jgi:hypothetical protein
MIKHAFRSGMSRRNDFEGAVSAGAPVGVVAGELGLMQVMFGIPKAVLKGVPVFVDSGAFTAFRKGGEPDFPAIMRDYRAMLDSVHDLDGDPSGLFLVSPDAVGDQNKTLALLRQWRPELVDLITRGASLIVPIQCGAMPVVAMLAEAIAILGTDKFIAGIPSNEAAMTVEQAATLRHQAFHILGRVQKNDQQVARIAALTAANPCADITADANWMRSRIGKICAATDAVKMSRAGTDWLDQFKQGSSRTLALKAMIQADTAWC